MYTYTHSFTYTYMLVITPKPPRAARPPEEQPAARSLGGTGTTPNSHHKIQVFSEPTLGKS